MYEWKNQRMIEWKHKQKELNQLAQRENQQNKQTNPPHPSE